MIVNKMITDTVRQCVLSSGEELLRSFKDLRENIKWQREDNR